MGGLREVGMSKVAEVSISFAWVEGKVALFPRICESGRKAGVKANRRRACGESRRTTQRHGSWSGSQHGVRKSWLAHSSSWKWRSTSRESNRKKMEIGAWGWTVSEQVEEEDLAEGMEKGKAGGEDRSTGTECVEKGNSKKGVPEGLWLFKSPVPCTGFQSRVTWCINILWNYAHYTLMWWCWGGGRNR